MLKEAFDSVPVVDFEKEFGKKREVFNKMDFTISFVVTDGEKLANRGRYMGSFLMESGKISFISLFRGKVLYDEYRKKDAESGELVTIYSETLEEAFKKAGFGTEWDQIIENSSLNSSSESK